MSLSTDSLSPYAAFLLYEYPARAVSKQARVDRLKTLSQAVIDSLDALTTRRVKQSPLRTDDVFAARGLWLERKSEPSWSKGAGLLDVSQHLVVWIEYAGKVGVAVSDAKLRREVQAVLNGQPGLSAMNPDLLESALLRDRTLRTLWLRGSHRKSVVKADSKVLSGLSLGSALNPLDDRTFTATSARASTDLAQGMPTVGVNLDRSYVWIGPCEDWGSFTARFRAFVDYMTGRATTPRSPLPILAQPLPGSPAAGSVREAFDFEFASTETTFSLDDETEVELKAVQARLGIRTAGNTNDQNFKLIVTDLDQPNPEATAAGAWHVALEIALDSRKVVATLQSNSTTWGRWKMFERLLSDKSLWSVWYESGHSLSNGRWTMLDAPASSFDGTITAVDFLRDGWSIADEKPQQGMNVLWDQIGADKEMSLFSWWIRSGMRECFPDFASAVHPPGFAYIVCDDGSNELGDFIVLAKDPCFAHGSNNPSELAFIMVHMKAASKSSDRQMAPKRFEEVLGQATKNLGRARFPDARNYILNAATGKKVPVWKWVGDKFQLALQKGHELPANDQMRADLAQFDGRRVHFHVVVVQPHQVAAAFRAAMQVPVPDFKTRMLCTLLCAADGAARAASAKFQVVMRP